MISQIAYTLLMAWKHRNSLKRYKNKMALQRDGILNCDPRLLKAQRIKAIVLDIDGVLTPYGETKLDPAIGSWLNACVQIYGKDAVFILTNKPTVARQQYFAQHFKGVTLILSPKKKPYPNGLRQILQRKNIKPEELVMIDDRLLTGILAAIVANTGALYITKPLVCLAKRPVMETFMMCLRGIERLLL